MAVDTHAPTSRGVLCNAGAGAAAGKSVLNSFDTAFIFFWVN